MGLVVGGRRERERAEAKASVFPTKTHSTREYSKTSLQNPIITESE